MPLLSYAAIPQWATVPEQPDPASRSAFARGRVIPGPNTPTNCLPTGLMAALTEVAAQFGDVTLLSTTHLQSDNHAEGSARARQHAACHAVDFRYVGRAQDILGYLKTRPEVEGVTGFRNGVIHVDAKGGAPAVSSGAPAARQKAATRRRPARKPAAEDATDEASGAAEADSVQN